MITAFILSGALLILCLIREHNKKVGAFKEANDLIARGKIMEDERKRAIVIAMDAARERDEALRKLDAIRSAVAPQDITY